MDVTFGDWVEKKRLALGITQGKLADAVGISRQSMSAIESGRIKLPNTDIRRRLAAALGVSHLDLLVAAGEITEAELGTSVGVVEIADDDPRERAIQRLRSITWTEGVERSVNVVLSILEAEQKG